MGRSSALLMSNAVAPHHVKKPMTLGSALGGIEGQGGPLIDAESRHSQQHLHPSAIMRPNAGRRVQRAETLSVAAQRPAGIGRGFGRRGQEDGNTGMAETVCPDGLGWALSGSWTAPSPNAQSSVHSTLLGRRNRLRGWPRAPRRPPVNALTRCSPKFKRSTAVAGGLRHHVWLEHPVAKAVAGSTYRCQADFDMESACIACSGEAASRGLVDCQTSSTSPSPTTAATASQRPTDRLPRTLRTP